MKGVTVESNRYALYVTGEGAVAQIEGCTVRDSKSHDYFTIKGGRIEGVDPSQINAR